MMNVPTEAGQAEDKLSLRDKVWIAQNAMKQFPNGDLSNRTEGQVELPIKHYFAHNMYAREMFVPRGVCLVGKIHKYEHISIISQGAISISIDDKILRIKAPFTFVAPSGSKRIAFAHTDTIWTVMHSTIEKDLDKIENYFIAEDEQEYLDFIQKAALNAPLR